MQGMSTLGGQGGLPHDRRYFPRGGGQGVNFSQRNAENSLFGLNLTKLRLN